MPRPGRGKPPVEPAAPESRTGSKSPPDGPPTEGGAGSAATPRTRGLLRHPSLGAWVAVLGAAVAYASFLGELCTLKYQDFLTFAYDLGNYNQIFWTTAEGHQFFFTTANSVQGSHGWVVLGHFSPIFVLLVPLYAIAPGPPALLFLQAGALAAGALPTFGLAQRLLRSDRWALGMAAVYLATPLTFWPAWYDFHPEVFMVAPILGVFYFLELKRPVPLLVCLVLGLMSVETAAPFVLAFFAIALVPSGWEWLRRRGGLFDDRLHWLGFLVTGAYLVLSFEVAVHNSVLGATFGGAFDYWPQLGAATAYQVYPMALLHPGAILPALSIFGEQKAVYVLLALGSLGFLPLLGPWKYTVPGYLWIGLIVLSANADFFYTGDMYACYLLPFFIAATVAALARARKWSERRAERAPKEAPSAERALRVHHRWRASAPALGLLTLLLTGVVVTNVIASPLASQPIDLFWATPSGWPDFTAHDAWTAKVLALVPSNAGIVCDGKDFSMVSDRANAWVTPWAAALVKGQTLAGLLDNAINRSTYILLDWRLAYQDSALTLQYGNFSDFGLLAAADGTYLWERGYSGPLQVWDPWTMALAGGDTNAGDAVVDPGNATALGPSLYHAPGTSNGTLLWTGLGVRNLPPGNYSLRAWVSVSSPQPGTQLAISTAVTPIYYQAVARTNYTGVGKFYFVVVPSPSSYLPGSPAVVSTSEGVPTTGNVTLVFSWNGLGILTNYGWALSPSSSVRLYSLTLQQLSP